MTFCLDIISFCTASSRSSCESRHILSSYSSAVPGDDDKPRAEIEGERHTSLKRQHECSQQRRSKAGTDSTLLYRDCCLMHECLFGEHRLLGLRRQAFTTSCSSARARKSSMWGPRYRKRRWQAHLFGPYAASAW